MAKYKIPGIGDGGKCLGCGKRPNGQGFCKCYTPKMRQKMLNKINKKHATN